MSNKHRKRISIHVTKNQGESSEKVISRFQKLVKSSRIINEVKDSRYHERSPRKRKMRAAAKMREFYRSKKEKEKFL